MDKEDFSTLKDLPNTMLNAVGSKTKEEEEKMFAEFQIPTFLNLIKL
jgi:hypothetical protein